MLNNFPVSFLQISSILITMALISEGAKDRITTVVWLIWLGLSSTGASCQLSSILASRRERSQACQNYPLLVFYGLEKARGGVLVTLFIKFFF